MPAEIFVAFAPAFRKSQQTRQSILFSVRSATVGRSEGGAKPTFVHACTCAYKHARLQACLELAGFQTKVSLSLSLSLSRREVTT